VHELDATFPADVAEKIRTRRARRIQAEEELKQWSNGLSEEELANTFAAGKKKKPKKSVAAANAPAGSLTPTAGPSTAIPVPPTEDNAEKVGLVEFEGLRFGG
jgi:hypothetical protein